MATGKVKETQTKFFQWLKKLGYDGPIPENFEKVCNAETSFIWEQLVEKVVSAKEASYIKNNVLFHKLKLVPKSIPIDHSVPELEAYKRRQGLSELKENLRTEVDEIDEKIEAAYKRNVIKYQLVGVKREKVKENEEKIHWFKQKSRYLNAEIPKVEEMLYAARNYTPVESFEASNADQITENLRQSSQILKDLIEHRKKLPDVLGDSMEFTFLEDTEGTITSSVGDCSFDDSLGILQDISVNSENMFLMPTDVPQDGQASNTDQITKDLLYSYNRNQVLNGLIELHKDKKDQLVNIIVDGANSGEHQYDHEAKFRLAKFCGENLLDKLKTIECQQRIGKNQEYLELQNNGLSEQLRDVHSPNQAAQLKTLILQSAQLKSLDGQIDLIREQIKHFKSKYKGQVESFNASKTKNSRLNAQISKIKNVLQNQSNFLRHVVQNINANRDAVGATIKKLTESHENMSWVAFLMEEVVTNEVETYFKSPLRRPAIDPADVGNGDTLCQLADLINRPHCPRESILLEILMQSKKTVLFQAMKDVRSKIKIERERIKISQDQKLRLDKAVDELNKLTDLCNSGKVSAVENIKETAKIWPQLPFKDFL